MAMFSQHQISPQELVQFDEYFAQCAELLRQMPWHKRLLILILDKMAVGHFIVP